MCSLAPLSPHTSQLFVTRHTPWPPCQLPIVRLPRSRPMWITQSCFTLRRSVRLYPFRTQPERILRFSPGYPFIALRSVACAPLRGNRLNLIKASEWIKSYERLLLYSQTSACSTLIGYSFDYWRPIGYKRMGCGINYRFWALYESAMRN